MGRTRAEDPLRFEIAEIVRAHPIAVGHPPLVVDSPIDKVIEATYDEIYRRAAEADAWDFA